MKLWQRVKILEDNMKKKPVFHTSTKLPLHNRDEYYVYRLPVSKSNVVFSLSGAIERLIWRFRRVFGMRIDFKQRVYGYGTKNHHMRLTIKIYFKQHNNRGGIR